MHRLASAQVWVKVVEIRDDGGGNPKINCSMKAVSQDDGADLDPGNAAAARRGGGDAQFRGPVSDAPPEVRPCVCHVHSDSTGRRAAVCVFLPWCSI
jgi:hypothetical protein